MRVVYLYHGDWPKGATRVARQTRSLAEAGHDVTLLSRNYTRRPRNESTPWMQVRRLRAFPSAFLNKLMNFPLFVHPAWLLALRRTCLDSRADCIVVADLPLAPTAVRVGGSLGLPVHYDMAEVYPLFLKSLRETTAVSLTDRLVKNPVIAERVESFVFDHVDSISVVSEESRLRCLSRGVDPGKVVVVGNTPEAPEQLAGDHPLPADLAPWCEDDRLLFVGVILADRGLVEAVEAMRGVVQERPRTALIVVGDGPDRGRVESRIRDLGLEQHVAMLGWKEPTELPGYLQHCHVGLLPFVDSAHVRVTLANKLFDYMGAGLPFLAVDVPPMRRVFEETGAGCLYAPGGDNLARQITKMLSEPAQLTAMGKRGKAAVAARYRWSVDGEIFVRRVEATARSGRQ